VLAIS